MKILLTCKNPLQRVIFSSNKFIGEDYYEGQVSGFKIKMFEFSSGFET